MGSGRSGSHGYMSCSTIAKRSTSRRCAAAMTGSSAGSPAGGSHITPRATAGPNGTPPARTAGEHGGVDLLEVEVADALAVRLDQLDAVAAAVRVVARVEAEGDEVLVRGVEEAGHVLLGVDVRVGVRVDDGPQAVPLADLVGEPLGLGGQVAPLRRRERGVLDDLARLVVPPERGDDDEMPGAGRAREFGDGRDVLPRRVPDAGAAVQAREDRAAWRPSGRAVPSPVRARPGPWAGSRTGRARSTRSRLRRPRRESAARGPDGGRRGTTRPRSRVPSRCGYGVTSSSWSQPSGRRRRVSRRGPNVRTKC